MPMIKLSGEGGKEGGSEGGRGVWLLLVCTCECEGAGPRGGGASFYTQKGLGVANTNTQLQRCSTLHYFVRLM